MGNPVAEVRERHGLTRKELAHLAGVSYDAVYRTEVALVTRPHRKIVEALAKLGYDPTKLRADFAGYAEELKELTMRKTAQGIRN